MLFDAIPLLLAGLLLQGPPADASAGLTAWPSVRRSVYAMGTELRAEIAGLERTAALAALEAAVSEIEAAERRLSTWGDNAAAATDLLRLNRSPARTWVDCGARTQDELRRACHWKRETGGAFDPLCGAWIALYDLRGSGRWPQPQEIAQLLAQTPFELEFEPLRLCRGNAQALLEEGGFGKGAGLDLAAAALREREVASALLDFGGQVSVVGPARAVEIAHPDRRAEPLVRVRLSAAALSTSGNSERGRSVDGVRLGHLIDPRSGRPADDWGALSVRCDSALDADCLSTGLYVLGPARALEFARTHPGVDVLCLIRAGDAHVRVAASSGFEGDLELLDPRCSLERLAIPD